MERTVSGTMLIVLLIGISILINIRIVKTVVGQQSGFRTVSSLDDLENPSASAFLDILQVTVETDDFTRLRLNMTLRGAPPDSHAFVNRTLDDNLSYAWWIDADRNSATGQRHQYVSSEFNIMTQVSGGSATGRWGARVDVTGSMPGGGAVQFVIRGNIISLLVSLSQIGNPDSFDYSVTTWGSLNGSSLGYNPETIAQTVDLQKPHGDSGIHQVIITPLLLELRDGVPTGKVKATAIDANGVALPRQNLDIVYNSDNPSVHVDQQGNVNAEDFGVAHIRAKVNGTLSANVATVNFGRIRIEPAILLLSVKKNPSASLRISVEDASGSRLPDSELETVFWISGGSAEVATVSSNGTVTAHRPPADFGETPYVSASVNGTLAHNSVVVRVTDTDLGMIEAEYPGTYISFYSPPANGMLNYNSTMYNDQVVRLTDLAYTLMREATGVVPYSGDTQFLVADPGHADGTVPYGLGGNPIRLGVDVDTGNSGFMQGRANPIPVWWVFFHEMGHSFLGQTARSRQFIHAPTSGSFSYSEGLASILGMYSAAMMDRRKGQHQIPDRILQTQTLLPTYHLSTTPDLENYRHYNNYSQLNPSVIYDIMLTMAQTYGFDKLVRFFAVFLPPDNSFPFAINSDQKQATFFIAALSSAVNADVRPFFRELGFPIDDSFYSQAKNETDIAAAYRDPNPQPGQSSTISTGTTAQLNGSESFDVFQSELKYNWTIVDRPANSEAILSDANTARPSFIADVPGNYTISLVVSNDLLTSSPRSITVVAKTFMATDLNTDGTVNILDITIVAAAYNTRLGDLGWNALADLDKNGTVNILDVTMVAKDYGKTV